MTKNKIIISVLSVFATIVSVFLVFAFIKWDINPAHWQENQRGCSISIGILISAYVLFLLSSITKET